MSFCILTKHLAFCQHVSSGQTFNMTEASNPEVRGFLSATHYTKCSLFKMLWGQKGRICANHGANFNQISTLWMMRQGLKKKKINPRAEHLEVVIIGSILFNIPLSADAVVECKQWDKGSFYSRRTKVRVLSPPHGPLRGTIRFSSLLL